MISGAQAAQATDVLTGGGVVLFGADTVYGLACAADRADAIDRMIGLKGRATDKPNAMLAFSLTAAEPLLATLAPRTQAAARALLPGPVTLVLPGDLGLRVPALVPGATELAQIPTLVVQSSANPAGGPAPARLQDVDPALRGAVDLALDAGELPGTASTVVDLTAFEDAGSWTVLREGAVTAQDLAASIAEPSAPPV